MRVHAPAARSVVGDTTRPACTKRRLHNACTFRPPQHPHRIHRRRALLRAVRASAQQTSAPQLTEKEAAAKEKFLQQLTSGSEGSIKQQAVALLREAARNRNVAPQLVIGALAHLESVAAERNDTLDWLQGRWRLVFGSAGPPFLLYIPVNEVTDIHVATSTIDLASDIGPFIFKFSGSFEWEAPSNMNFAFNGSRITAFQRELSSKEWTPEKRKTYSFYYVDENIAALRSSQGGYILMLKVSTFK